VCPVHPCPVGNGVGRRVLVDDNANLATLLGFVGMRRRQQWREPKESGESEGEEASERHLVSDGMPSTVRPQPGSSTAMRHFSRR
jgi:hypothetical protein